MGWPEQPCQQLRVGRGDAGICRGCLSRMRRPPRHGAWKVCQGQEALHVVMSAAQDSLHPLPVLAQGQATAGACIASRGALLLTMYTAIELLMRRAWAPQHVAQSHAPSVMCAVARTQPAKLGAGGLEKRRLPTPCSNRRDSNRQTDPGGQSNGAMPNHSSMSASGKHVCSAAGSHKR